MIHFNWTQLIPGVGHYYIHIATALLATAILTVMSLRARAALGTGEVALRPADKLSVRAFFELMTELIVNLTEMVIGEHGKKYVPMFASIFVFILINNLIGLLPGMSAATENLNTTLAIGLFSFVVYNYEGIKENGIVGYIKHFFGPWLPMAPVILIIELISHFIRPLTLGLRLMGNMTGDHTLLSIFTGMAPAWWVPVALPFYFLGLLVCVLQAVVFTLLSMVYIAMATAHDH